MSRAFDQKLVFSRGKNDSLVPHEVFHPDRGWSPDPAGRQSSGQGD